jgi:hypothetical protein
MPGKMVVDQFGPSVDIKISGRDQAASEWQDLKDDFVAVSTTRQINSPAGAWALTLVSRRDKQGRTWAKRIRPMDYIEIRFGRYTKRPAKPKMVMRGLVDKLSETIGVDGSGKPQRQITISGKDMGKMLLLKQLYILHYTSSEALLAELQGQQGSEGAIFTDLWNKFREQPFMKPQEFMDKVHDYIYKATNVGGDSSGGGTGPTNLVANVPDMKFVSKDMDDLVVSPVTLMTLQGSVWNLFEHYHGTPVCELIVHDTDEGPELLWRWAPFKDRDAKIISPSSNDGKPVTIDAKEIMQYSIETNDSDLWNYYFTFAKPVGMMGTDFKWFAVGEGNPTYRKKLIDRYGFRPLEIQMPLAKLEDGHPPEEKLKEQIEDWRKMGKQISEWADKAYSHAPRLEGGMIVMRGDERLDIGTYMEIRQTKQEFYVEAIRHDFTLNPPRFTSSVTVSRGLWLENNPYPEDEGEASTFTPSGSGGDPLVTGGNDSGDTNDFTPPPGLT